MGLSALKGNTPSLSPRRITREVLEHLSDPIAVLVWQHWIATGEAILEGP